MSDDVFAKKYPAQKKLDELWEMFVPICGIFTMFFMIGLAIAAPICLVLLTVKWLFF